MAKGTAKPPMPPAQQENLLEAEEEITLPNQKEGRKV
jgi:hypothetical protein